MVAVKKRLMDRIGETVKGRIAETLCPFINLFCTKRHLEMWREKNPEFKDGEIYSPNEAMVHGKTIFGDFLE